MLTEVFSNMEVSWQMLLLLPLLVGLEAILSADNAIALAAISRGLEDPNLERKALNFGLVAAFVLRIALIFTAQWVFRYRFIELAGAAYLLWLAWNYFREDGTDASGRHQTHHRFYSLWQAIPLIALTDLAFSLDSVTTAIALAPETWLVVAGGAVGVITLRFMAELFIRWLQDYERLEDAGYIAVAAVGARLLLRVVNPAWAPPEWMMVTAIALVFIWGFSKRNLPRVERLEPEPEDSTPA
jgi:YkoY family integral membrane protein